MRKNFTYSTQKLNFRHMEKEALISALKEKAGVDNLSDRTIDEVATLFLPQFADDEKITDESWNVPLQMMKTMSGQLRHDLSGGINAFKTQFETENKAKFEKEKQDALDAFKAEWEKNHPSEKKPEEKPTETDIDKKLADFEEKMMAKMTGDDSAFGKLSKQFSDYLKAQEEKEKTATEEQMRSEILKLVMSYDGLDADDVIVENTMLKLQISKDKDMATLKNEVKSIYEKVYKKFVEKHGGGQPFNGGGGGGGGISPAIQSHLDRVAKEAKDAEEYSNSIQFAK